MAKTWKSSGGDGAITCTSLANGSARQGGKVDISALSGLVSMQVRWKPASSPTANSTIDVYMAFSKSGTAGTDNDGDASGSDAAYPTDGTLANRLKQLTFVGSLVLDAVSESHIQHVGSFARLADYGMPILVNNSGVAGSATATDFEVILESVPLPS
ncbi:hypothetical protein KC887_00240 [Candidatus Kaiserbacteria bacterium]|nr:hypothetical protein [Candidatus Kaiserbacteria bacterium]